MRNPEDLTLLSILRKEIPSRNIEKLEQMSGSFSFGFRLKINHEQKNDKKAIWEKIGMAFFNSAVTVLQTLVIALGAGLGIWGAINLLEGYGNDNPGAKSQGMKQLMAGGGVALIGITLVPLLSGLFG